MKYATCHPDKLDHAKGWCAACYQRNRRANSETARQAHRDSNKRWLKENPESRKKFVRKFRYGLIDVEYKKMFDTQHGLCAICQAEPATHVDHNHVTGRVRGLLCSDCNLKLGQYEQLLLRPGFVSYAL